jgi:hypothetical protein
MSRSRVTTVLSVSFLPAAISLLPGTWFALYRCTYKIGFPGWPEPILDSVTGFGASITKEGACTGPLFHFRRRLCHRPRNASWAVLIELVDIWSFPRIVLGLFARALPHRAIAKPFRNRVCAEPCDVRSLESQKNKRPVGGPAARAWGMEGTVIRSPFGSSGRSAALASSRTTHRSKRSQPLNYSRKPEPLLITCLVCFSPELPSIARRIHSLQYSPFPLVYSSSVRKYCYC